MPRTKNPVSAAGNRKTVKKNPDGKPATTRKSTIEKKATNKPVIKKSKAKIRKPAKSAAKKRAVKKPALVKSKPVKKDVKKSAARSKSARKITRKKAMPASTIDRRSRAGSTRSASRSFETLAAPVSIAGMGGIRLTSGDFTLDFLNEFYCCMERTGSGETEHGAFIFIEDGIGHFLDEHRGTHHHPLNFSSGHFLMKEDNGMYHCVQEDGTMHNSFNSMDECVWHIFTEHREEE